MREGEKGEKRGDVKSREKKDASKCWRAGITCIESSLLASLLAACLTKSQVDPCVILSYRRLQWFPLPAAASSVIDNY